MTDNPTLFDAAARVTREAPGLYRHDAPRTSRDAAENVAPRSGTGRARVLATIAALGGATDEEIQDQLNMRVQTETPRRNELVRDGFVVDSGTTRATSSGCAAIVWELTGDGRAVLQAIRNGSL